MSFDANFTFIKAADSGVDYRCKLHGNEFCFETLCLRSNANAEKPKQLTTLGKVTGATLKFALKLLRFIAQIAPLIKRLFA